MEDTPEQEEWEGIMGEEGIVATERYKKEEKLRG